jgi:hypothetical protein
MVRTHLSERWAGLKVSRSLPDYATVEQEVLEKLEAASRESTEPQVVAQTILRILQSPSPAPHYLVGKEHWYLLLSKIIPASVLESVMSKRLGLSG